MKDDKEFYMLTRKEYKELLLAVLYAIIKSRHALSMANKTKSSLMNMSKA